MSIKFESYLQSLSKDEFAKLIQKRIALLNPEQQLIAQARESQREYRTRLIESLSSTDEDIHEQVFNALQDMDGDECEHNISHDNYCQQCEIIEKIMFPEIYGYLSFSDLTSSDL